MKIRNFTVSASSKKTKNYQSQTNDVTFTVECDEALTPVEAVIEATKLSWMAKEKLLQDERCQGLISNEHYVFTLQDIRKKYRKTLESLTANPGKLIVDVEKE